MIDLSQQQERVILIAAGSDSQAQSAELDRLIENSMEASLNELEELATTAGAVTVGRMIQNREAVHPATYLGKGKLEELKMYISALDATGIIADDELSASQIANMEKILDVKVMDRTLLILDIFAARANTNEGSIQVELAQLRYRAVHLTGEGIAMSRLGGGIGTRGPGEKKLEIDRRRIHDRISQLKTELDQVVRHREVTRQRRSRNSAPVAAIVGYTNAGKSTLLNKLTGAGVLEEDKLFATLDPTTRALELEGKQQILVTDTVGFISKLPHQLVDAFRSTLEEAKYADIILHVVDASNPQFEKQMYVVYQTLKELGVEGKPIITFFNKMDQVPGNVRLRDMMADHCVYGSAKTGEGLDHLKIMLASVLRQSRILYEGVLPYAKTGMLAIIRQKGQLISEEYTADGIAVKAYIPAELFGQLK